jgi:hypothetical protein
LPVRPRGEQYSVITVIAKPPRRRTTRGRFFFGSSAESVGAGAESALRKKNWP